MHTSNLAVHKYKIEVRRKRVASMLAQSMTETEIADKLKVDQSTISKRYQSAETVVTAVCLRLS
jgi:DNA-binding NarL/FixJ family response regulator